VCSKITVIITSIIYLSQYNVVKVTTRNKSVACNCVKEFDGNYELGRALRDPTLRGDKWIVVTTVQSPTDAVRTLAKQSGWKVVVVGDKKTPKSWRYVL